MTFIFERGKEKREHGGGLEKVHFWILALCGFPQPHYSYTWEGQQEFTQNGLS